MSEYTVQEERENWLEHVLNTFFSYAEDGRPPGLPDEMIGEAAQKAFTISTSLGLIPGPLGIASIVPEVIALAKVHINLIHRIARYHNKQDQVTKEIVLLILANVMGVAVGEALVKNVGTRLIVKSVDTEIMKRLARKIGSRIINEAAEKAIGRWLPMLTAPLFGYFSRSLTKKIGREANRLFSGVAEFSQA